MPMLNRLLVKSSGANASLLRMPVLSHSFFFSVYLGAHSNCFSRCPAFRFSRELSICIPKTIVQVSGLKALEGDSTWESKIEELMNAVDASIPEPEREVDKPFLMAVEDVFSITGRGTVATGRIERGKVTV